MATYSLTTASNLFKTKFGPLSENTYNSANVILGRVKKRFDFVGDQIFISVPTSFSGGVGSGTLPTAGVATYEKALILAKKVYAVAEYDRESIKASSSSEGAFIEGIKEITKKAIESYMRNFSRIWHNDGTGSLGTIAAGGVVNTDPIFILTLTSATFKEANLEENDLIQIGAGQTSSLFKIDAVDPTNLALTVTRSTGAIVPAAADVLFMQGSENNDPEGLKGILDATSGTKYNITVARRWQAVQKSAASAGLSTDLMNEVMLDVQKQSGKVPNLIQTSFKQYRKLLNLLEDQKQYNLPARAANLKGQVSFRGVEFMSAAGAVGVFPNRMVEDDRMYFLNDNWLVTHHRPDFGWFDDDGTVFLRKAGADTYEARYGGYMQNYIVPSFHGVMTNLA